LLYCQCRQRFFETEGFVKNRVLIAYFIGAIFFIPSLGRADCDANYSQAKSKDMEQKYKDVKTNAVIGGVVDGAKGAFFGFAGGMTLGSVVENAWGIAGESKTWIGGGIGTAVGMAIGVTKSVLDYKHDVQDLNMESRASSNGDALPTGDADSISRLLKYSANVVNDPSQATAATNWLLMADAVSAQSSLPNRKPDVEWLKSLYLDQSGMPKMPVHSDFAKLQLIDQLNKSGKLCRDGKLASLSDLMDYVEQSGHSMAEAAPLQTPWSTGANKKSDSSEATVAGLKQSPVLPDGQAKAAIPL
jgi:hypothetical protein